MGRPTEYTEELAQEICSEIACNPAGLRQIAKKNPHWPQKSTIYKWLSQNKEFAERYARAKKAQSRLLVDQIVAIADNRSRDLIETIDEMGRPRQMQNHVAVQRDRLRIDSRKFIATKLLPEVYGDKQTIITKPNLDELSLDNIIQAVKMQNADGRAEILRALLDDVAEENSMGF